MADDSLHMRRVPGNRRGRDTRRLSSSLWLVVYDKYCIPPDVSASRERTLNNQLSGAFAPRPHRRSARVVTELSESVSSVLIRGANGHRLFNSNALHVCVFPVRDEVWLFGSKVAGFNFHFTIPRHQRLAELSWYEIR